MKSPIVLCLIFFSSVVYAVTNKSKSNEEIVNKALPTKEVIENPTLKTLSGGLNKYSLYSSFTYRGGSLSDPVSALRPNIQKAQETVGLSNMSGNFGVKYRASKQDNLSFQVGLYSTTPFHSSLDTKDSKIQKDFDENHKNLDADDPTLSYFRTYYIGNLQNITFIKYQYVTRGIYRDYGLRSAIALSHAAAYKINKAAYIAASLTYENYHYDRSSTKYMGHDISLLPYQTQHKFRGNISAEFYLKRNISLRFITDVYSAYRMKEQSKIQKRVLQQTLATTYFFSRDISIAPNIRFIAKDIRTKRTNVGLTLNVNL